jgi:hypothetical protein
MREQQTTGDKTMTMTKETTRITEITGQFSMDDLGNASDKETLISMISEAPKGGIIHVKAYESKGGYGEVADYFYLKGVDYGKMKERSLAKLKEIADNENFSIKVTRGVWTGKDGIKHNRKAKGRTYSVVTETYTADNPMMNEAIREIEHSILNPYKKGAEYQKEGNGVYSMEDQSLHIRDCQLLHKIVLREGDYPKKASSENVALRNAIKRSLPISKYRQVKLDGRFDYISVGGQILMQDESGENVYVGFSEHKGLLTPRINGLTEVLESVKVPTNTLEAEPVEPVDPNTTLTIEDIFGA